MRALACLRMDEVVAVQCCWDHEALRSQGTHVWCRSDDRGRPEDGDSRVWSLPVLMWMLMRVQMRMGVRKSALRMAPRVQMGK